MSIVNSSPGDNAGSGTPLKICCVALNAYPVINPSAQGTFGGIETRSWMFARALAAMPKIDVEFVVRHTRPVERDVVDGVKLKLWLDRLYPLRESVLSRVTPTSQFPYLKFHKPSLSLLWELPVLAVSKLLRGGSRNPLQPHPIFAESTADLFLTYGVQGNSGTVIASAHATGRKAVLFLGSDGDLDERYMQEGNFVSVYRDRADVCRWLIQQADHIIVQTELQRILLRERFQREGTVIANPIDVERWDALADGRVSNREAAALERYALWIGRADGEHKRPQLCIELARMCPEVRFLMVLNPRDDVVEAQVRASAPPNVTIVRSIPYEEIPALFRRAAVLVNTSSLEGFPNTYLQAALSGVPVASLVVEQEFLELTRAGVCTQGDLRGLAAFMQDIWSRRPLPQAAMARAYVESRHGLGAKAGELAAVLRGLAAR